MHALAASSALRLYRLSMLGFIASVLVLVLLPFTPLLLLPAAVALLMFIAVVQFSLAAPGLGRYVVAMVGCGVGSVVALIAGSGGWSPDPALMALSAVFSAAGVFLFHLLWISAAGRLSLWHLQPRMWGATALAVLATLLSSAQRLGAISPLAYLVLGLGSSVISLAVMWQALGQLQHTLDCRVTR